MVDKSTNNANDLGGDLQFVSVFVFLAGAIFRRRNFSDNGYCKKQFEPNRDQNFAVKPLTCTWWFHLSFEHFQVISMVGKSGP